MGLNVRKRLKKQFTRWDLLTELLKFSAKEFEGEQENKIMDVHNEVQSGEHY